MNFEIGQIYSRLHDIHEVYGGQRQSGISPSSEHPFIFIFSGKAGETYGYEDGWHEKEEVFLYSGEGQTGDMEFSRGNKAIRDHVVNGKRLLLFEALGKRQPVRYQGEFSCASYDYGEGPDRNGDVRKTIRFHLVPVGEDKGEIEDPLLEREHQPNLELEELRRRALEASEPSSRQNWRQAKVLQRARRQEIRAYEDTDNGLPAAAKPRNRSHMRKAPEKSGAFAGQ